MDSIIFSIHEKLMTSGLEDTALEYFTFSNICCLLLSSPHPSLYKREFVWSPHTLPSSLWHGASENWNLPIGRSVCYALAPLITPEFIANEVTHVWPLELQDSG